VLRILAKGRGGPIPAIDFNGLYGRPGAFPRPPITPWPIRARFRQRNKFSWSELKKRFNCVELRVNERSRTGRSSH
jgi:hypothetical protein